MVEEMSLGEIQRNIKRIDDAMRTLVAQDAWSRENLHLRDEIGKVREEIGRVDRDCHERSDDVEETALAAVARAETTALAAVARAEKRTNELAKATTDSFKSLDTRGQNTWGRVATVVGLVVSLGGLLWAVYASSKGIK